MTKALSIFPLTPDSCKKQNHLPYNSKIALRFQIENSDHSSQLQKSLFCHPEQSEGSYNILALQDSSLR